jgi:tRNA(Ile)-lysidine synthase
MALFTDSAIQAAKKLIPRGSGVLVAVSGGVDSMVLLRVLDQISGDCRWRLVVAHFNHKLRGRASSADQRLVETTARKLRLKLASSEWSGGSDDVKKNGPEMAARNARLGFLAKAARRHRCTHVATGHHRDDQVETFFWRLFRGAGGGGLGAMRPKDDFPLKFGLKIIRPLLAFSKPEIREFAAGEKLQHREDKSNEDRGILRNRIRHLLLPYLRGHFGAQVDASVGLSMELIGADADCLKALSRTWLNSVDGYPFEDLHPAMQRWILWHQMIEHGVEPGNCRLEDLRLAAGKEFSLGPGSTLMRDISGRLHLRDVATLEHSAVNENILLGARWTRMDFGGLEIRCRVCRAGSGGRTKRFLYQELFDADLVGEEIRLRHWQPGDRFQPIGNPRPTKLQNLFTNAKVSAKEKRKRVLACTLTGKVFWVQGLRIGERAKITPKTRRILKWEWNEL